MSNIIISRTRQEVILDLPSLTSVGEEFDLVGKRFKKGTIGRVTQVLGQSGGYTRVRLAVYKGHILPQMHQQVFHDHNEGIQDNRPAPSLVDVPEFEEHPAGGSSWLGMDNDPRPRQGQENDVVSDGDPSGVVAGDDEGSIVMVTGEGGVPVDASSLSEQDPQTGAGRVEQPKTPTQAVSSVIGLTLGKAVSSGGVEKVSQEEHVKAFGGKIDDKVGAVGGKRIKRQR